MLEVVGHPIRGDVSTIMYITLRVFRTDGVRWYLVKDLLWFEKKVRVLDLFLFEMSVTQEPYIVKIFRKVDLSV